MSGLVSKEHQKNFLEILFIPPKVFLRDTSDGIANRDEALKLLEIQKIAAQNLGVTARAIACCVYQAWLKIIDPNSYDDGKKIIDENIENIDTALPFLELASRYNIKVSTEVLEGELRRRALISAPSRTELVLRHAILTAKNDQKEISEFLVLQREKIVPSIFEVGSWAAQLIEALCAIGNVDQAEAVLNDNRSELGDSAPQLEIRILHARGDATVATRAFEQFETTKSDIDLINLLTILENSSDLAQLEKYAQLALDRQPNPINLRRLVKCLGEQNKHREVISICEKYKKSLRFDDWILSQIAWSKFFLGDLPGSKEVASSFINGSQIALKLNISLFSGEWEEFPELVSAARRSIDKHPIRASDCIQMARFLAYSDRNASIDFLESIVNGRTLSAVDMVSAGQLAINLGRDDLGLGWLSKASTLPNAARVIRSATNQEVVDVLVETRKTAASVYDTFRLGEIPLHLLCLAIRVPLPKFLIGTFLKNYSEVDPRKRAIVPVSSGQSRSKSLKTINEITVDATALLVAGSLGVLDTIGKRFSKIFVAWDVLQTLFQAHWDIKIQQPSQIELSKKLLLDIDRGHLRGHPLASNPPSWL